MISITFAIIIVSIWLLGLSAGLYWLFLGQRQFHKIRQNPVLDRDELANQLDKIQKAVLDLSERQNHSLQKIGVTRFNPFRETGGDQSFSVILLNGRNDGIILTSLHSRGSTRTYAKSVNLGKSEYALSKEEQNALQKLVTKI